MSKKQCPYCKGKVTYWQKLKPAFDMKQHFVTCSHCEKKISDFWIKGAIGLALGGGGAGMMAGRSENAIQSIIIVGAVFVALMLLAPLNIELKKCNEMNAEKIRQDRLAKEMEFNWKRALLLAVLCIGFLAGAVWLIQPAKI